ncbi:MAG: T9SS type A sorting domain-containing protein [Saprospiraceae bacterium]|nr:T9SS type A sorting domain-containing protein [Saprospiraceae bacterium]
MLSKPQRPGFILFDMAAFLLRQIIPCAYIYVLCFLPNVDAQEWEAPNEFKSLVYELFPDTLSNQMFIGGKFTSIDGVRTGTIVSYDGQVFHHSMADSSSNMNYCWNGGCRGVASIISYKGDIIASLVRSSTYDAMPQIIGIGRWDGQTWHPLDGGIASLYQPTLQYYSPATAYDFCVADDTLYIAGYLHFVDSLPARGLASWDGEKWHIFDVPQPEPGLAVLANSVAKYKGNVYLGGNFIVPVDGEETCDLIRFDGTSWHKVGSGLIDGLTNLHDLEVFQDKLYVAGYFAQADGNPGNSIMSWDGEQWNDLGGGVCTPFGAIDDLFVNEDKLYIAGYFDCIGGIEAHNVASWDGEKWCSIGNSMFNRAIHAVAVWRDTVYVGGSFFEIDGQPAKYFAKYVGDHAMDTCSAPVSAAPEVQVGKKGLRLWPNPATELLQINAPTPIESVWVYDAQGREVLRPNVSGDQASVSVAHLPAGLYYVALRAGGKIWGGRFVKE